MKKVIKEKGKHALAESDSLWTGRRCSTGRPIHELGTEAGFSVVYRAALTVFYVVQWEYHEDDDLFSNPLD